jgi:hypothetical protein
MCLDLIDKRCRNSYYKAVEVRRLRARRVWAHWPPILIWKNVT